MTFTLFLIPVLIFSFILLSIVTVLVYVSYRKDRNDLLKKLESEARLNESKHRNTTREKMRDLFLRVIKTLGALAKPKEEAEISRLKQRFLQAGLGKMKNMTMIFYGSKILCTVLFPTIFLVIKLSFFWNMASVNLLFMIIMLAVLGFYAPVIWLNSRIKSTHGRDIPWISRWP